MIMRFWLIRGRLEAGPDDHERAGVVELAERRPRRRWRDPSTRTRRRRARRPAGPWAASPACRASRPGWPRRREPAGAGPAEGSLTVMSEIPWARSTATSSRPTGPAPVTSTRSSGWTSASRSACRVMAVGSARAATLVGRESGIRIRPSAATVLYWQNAPRYPAKSAVGTVQAHRRAAPPAGPAPPHPGDGFPTTRSPGTSRSHRARRPRCPTTRGREWRPVWRSAPGPCADRTRRCRTRRSRRAPRRVPAPDAGTSSTAILPSPT